MSKLLCPNKILLKFLTNQNVWCALALPTPPASTPLARSVVDDELGRFFIFSP